MVKCLPKRIKPFQRLISVIRQKGRVMTPFWLTVILITLTILCVVMGFVKADDSESDATVFWSFGGLFVGMVAIAFPLVFYLSIHFNRISCDTFSQQTERTTKFIFYNSWSTGDCLTKTKDGKWIPTKNLREFGEQP
jgi:RsiW-degrading membrane proteinase PrsW (M82 family)